jgi:hypothetical protein
MRPLRTINLLVGTESLAVSAATECCLRRSIECLEMSAWHENRLFRPLKRDDIDVLCDIPAALYVGHRTAMQQHKIDYRISGIAQKTYPKRTNQG